MIRFTQHALRKFELFKRHDLRISQGAVIRTVNHPDEVDYSRFPVRIAQHSFDTAHVLRVVYKEENEEKLIVTFYIGRKSRYEKEY